MTTKPRNQQAGFTLIEAMIAMFILTVSLLALAQLMLVSLDKTQFSNYDTKAVNLAQSKLEELRTAFGWEVESGGNSDLLATGTHGPETITLPARSGTLQGIRNFQISWQVTDLTSGRKSISVTVTPLAGNPRQSESITITTYLAP
jgi:prepilin-type N-terminal cleavage/methylation domain-containing protein